MGIPGLFSYICEHYPDVVLSFKKEKFQSSPMSIDYLYIDTNALIHPCAQSVFNYGGGKRWMDPHRNLTYEEKIQKLIEKVCSTLEEVRSLFSPKKGMMIAVDGIAPFAKQLQQRQRRYRSSKDRKDEEFDSNVISPGTSFMFDLHLRLLRWCDDLAKREAIEVVYSSYMTSCEGEHKCLDQIRRMSKKSREGDSHLIYGPDGDLLVLGLVLPAKHVYTAREDMMDANRLSVVNVDILRESLCTDMKIELDYLSDFVLVASVLGNDFLPRIQMFSHLSRGMMYIVKKWKDISSSGSVKEINLLKNLFEKLAFDEEELLKEQLNRYATGDKCFDSALVGCFVPGDTVFDGGKFLKQEYKIKYYKRAGIARKMIPEVCRDYIKTLLWIHYYYTVGITEKDTERWKWRYPYFYAPLMEDLNEYVKSFTDTRFSGDRSKPIDPFLQLLYILPPKSCETCLPKVFEPIYRDDRENFPLEFDIDYEGKAAEHEAVVKIQFPDVDVLEKKYLENKKFIREYPRNQRRRQFIWPRREKIDG
jgi:5'-3' exoribonuclease 1